MHVHRVRVLGTAGLLALFLVSPAAAQVCGDATGDGNVTVSDGVQALRAAALLSSSCSNATCDVDGSGTITVTDGVGVLRKAAGLPAPNVCPGGGVNQEVEQVVTGTIAPFLIFGFSGVTNVSPASAAGAGQDVENCPLGGTRTKMQVGCCIIRIALAQCRYGAPTLGTYAFNGPIAVNFAQFQVLFDFSTTEESTATTVKFDGFVSFAPSGGDFVADGGPITVATAQGDFTLFLQQLVFDDEGRPRSGGGRAEDPNDIFALQQVSFTVTSDTTADVVATFDDGMQARFVLNLVTGDFTPV